MPLMRQQTPLGLLLRERRRASKVGFKQLYAATGLEPETLRKWEVGEIQEPPLRGVLLYAREVGITLDELVEAALPASGGGADESRVGDAARLLPARPRERKPRSLTPRRRPEPRPSPAE